MTRDTRASYCVYEFGEFKFRINELGDIVACPQQFKQFWGRIPVGGLNITGTVVLFTHDVTLLLLNSEYPAFRPLIYPV